MSQTLLDLGVSENAIALSKAKARETLDKNLEARKARQLAQGMKQGFDFGKVEGIAKNEMLERRAKAQAEDAAAEAAKQATPVVEEPKAEESK